MFERNLAGGRIDVEIETKDGLRYVVSRSAGEDPVVLTPQGEPTELTLRFGGVFKADVFSQNEVEGIADRALSQLSLIDNFAAEKLVAVDRHQAPQAAVLAGEERRTNSTATA